MSFSVGWGDFGIMYNACEAKITDLQGAVFIQKNTVANTKSAL